MFRFFFSHPSEPMESTSHQINFQLIPYHPNDISHQSGLQNEIKHFMDCYDKLFNASVRIAAPYTATTLLWLANVYGSTIFLSLAAVITAYEYARDNEFKVQQTCQANFNEQLRQLLNIYQKSAQQHGPAITQDETILTLLRAIAPFVKADDLLCWPVYQTNPASYSAEFKKLLQSEPHCIPSALLQASAVNPMTPPNPLLSHGVFGKAGDRLSNSAIVRLGIHGAARFKQEIFGLTPEKTADKYIF